MIVFGIFGLIILKTFSILNKCGGAMFGKGSKNKDILWDLDTAQFTQKN